MDAVGQVEQRGHRARYAQILRNVNVRKIQMDSLLSFSRLSREIRRAVHCGGRSRMNFGDVVPFLVVGLSQEWLKSRVSVSVLTGRDRLWPAKNSNDSIS